MPLDRRLRRRRRRLHNAGGRLEPPSSSQQTGIGGALGRELCVARTNTGTCRRVIERMESIGGDVTTVLFPHTAHKGLTPATIAQVVRTEALRHWQAMQSQG